MKFVELKRKYMDAEDNVYDPGSVIELADDLADELIKSEKAVAHDGIVKEVKASVEIQEPDTLLLAIDITEPNGQQRFYKSQIIYIDTDFGIEYFS